MNSEHRDSDLISQKEKAEILTSLENEFFGSSDNLESDPAFQSNKKGLLLPALIVFFSVAATLATIFLLPLIPMETKYQNDLGSLREERSGNRVFSAYKAETEKTLSDKTRQIEVYEKKINDYDSKLLYLRNLINRNIGEQDAAVSEELPQYRNMSDEEIKAEISRLESEKETASKEMEKTKREILESETDDPFSEVARFQQLQNQESLITEQISFFYNLVLEDLDTMKFDNARKNLLFLRDLIESETNKDFPSIGKRKPIDRRIISFLETHIETLENRAGDDNPMEELSSRAQLYVLNGDKLAELGKFEEAEQFYRESLELLPYLDRAYRQLEDYNDRRWQAIMDEQSLQLESITAQADRESLAPAEEIVETEGKTAETIETALQDDPYIISENQKLFGVLATMESQLVTIEAFKDDHPPEGTEFSVRRFDSSGDEMIVAAGLIIMSSQEIIKGEISILFGEGILRPAQDLIYLVIEE